MSSLSPLNASAGDSNRDSIGEAGRNTDTDGGRAGTGAPPEAWAKLSSLTYTCDGTGEKLPFPTGLIGLLKAISDVLNHCVATGDLAASS